MLRSKTFVGLIGLMAAAAVVATGPALAASTKEKTARSQKRGGYSYKQQDTINTYGDARGRYGSANSLRDPNLGRQTNAGPFDHGFFFDSGIAPRGGDSPYRN